MHRMPRGRLSEMEARGLFAQMAEALRHSHALDVVHRDRSEGATLEDWRIAGVKNLRQNENSKQ